MPYAPLGLGVGIMAMPAMSACVGYLHIAISHKGVLSANAMSKVLTEICIPVKGVVNRGVCLSLLPKRALLRCIDMKMCEYEGRKKTFASIGAWGGGARGKPITKWSNGWVCFQQMRCQRYLHRFATLRSEVVNRCVCLSLLPK